MGSAPIVSRTDRTVARGEANISSEMTTCSWSRPSDSVARCSCSAYRPRRWYEKCPTATYLDLCDVLVTDYSSVANDFLLLRRPIVDCPDLGVFLKGGGFYFDPLTPHARSDDPHPCRAVRRTRGARRGPGPPNVDQLVEHFWGSTATTGESRRVARFPERGGPARLSSPSATGRRAVVTL